MEASCGALGAALWGRGLEEAGLGLPPAACPGPLRVGAAQGLEEPACGSSGWGGCGGKFQSKINLGQPEGETEGDPETQGPTDPGGQAGERGRETAAETVRGASGRAGVRASECESVSEWRGAGREAGSGVVSDGGTE